ncbi:nitrite reductase small subunit [Vibrio orientalis CIP 102891 = ATCC 33934]|jgi:nitrite reductase (NADH) small subunit|uniref:Nitrite reductase (NADH) small subunit n=1 Tax=Vibrio orientalis CIP 102891 = ATCC 33934 TaxID=675816 RepID=C9QKU4_VIBOR|nr:MULTISPECIES: nitrite reductase small subunit NirD [Vibrio]EEX92429.1 nitrite reductase [NAD(P)H] small subunit [Vibrio orientalis CIP 102891 = ATCC 33934]EGU49483.1 nitrite reductase small subunit [Vibrio orientalis CIP 102891 = ATCC 33934]KOO13448.1 nitrite reductase [Vibrio xuii]
MAFTKVCNIEDIIPGTGVVALVDGEQVAIFRPRATEEVFAINNMDPFFQSNVLSRGLIVEHDEQLWVASPLKKQRFNLKTGACMENEQFNVKAYKARVTKGSVEIAA